MTRDYTETWKSPSLNRLLVLYCASTTALPSSSFPFDIQALTDIIFDIFHICSRGETKQQCHAAAWWRETMGTFSKMQKGHPVQGETDFKKPKNCHKMCNTANICEEFIFDPSRNYCQAFLLMVYRGHLVTYRGYFKSMYNTRPVIYGAIQSIKPTVIQYFLSLRSKPENPYT